MNDGQTTAHSVTANNCRTVAVKKKVAVEAYLPKTNR
jgi:hypothetical protein